MYSPQLPKTGFTMTGLLLVAVAMALGAALVMRSIALRRI
jgi:LPXTG-motif cell wall-anchored protein